MESEHQYSYLAALLLPEGSKRAEYSSKDQVNRLKAYIRWLAVTGGQWQMPNLVVYQQHLLNERNLSKTSVNAHIYTVRNRYRALLGDGTLRERLDHELPTNIEPEQRQAIIEDTLLQIRKAIEDSEAILTLQRPKVIYRRLTAEHIRLLLNHPNLKGLGGKRDAAIFTLLFTTGMRNNELCALLVRDLTDYYDYNGDHPALHVPEGPGCVERLIPYGRLDWGLKRTQEWLQAASGSSPNSYDSVFRAFYKPVRNQAQVKIRPGGLSSRSLDRIFDAYPIEMEGQQIILTPMDLRRANARLLFEAGYELEAIKQRLGLNDNNALMDYIGGPEASLGLSDDMDILEQGTWMSGSMN